MSHSLEPLITAPVLAAALERSAGDWVVFDCRFDLGSPASGQQIYQDGHIAGARYAHLDHDLAAAPGPGDGRHPLPDRARFRAWLGEQGVGPETRVVAYDDASGAFAARLWWLLKWLGHDEVAVLSGGLAAWLSSGLAITAQPTTTDPRPPYPDSAVDPQMVVSASALLGAVADGRLLLDVRAPERYSGDKEPLDPVAGHVPGAVNWPFQNNLDTDGLFQNVEAIRQNMQDLLAGQPTEEVIAMCGSGVTACHLLLAMEAAGLKGARLYPGSWSEWIRDANRPVAIGLEPGGTAAD